MMSQKEDYESRCKWQSKGYCLNLSCPNKHSEPAAVENAADNNVVVGEDHAFIADSKTTLAVSNPSNLPGKEPLSSYNSLSNSFYESLKDALQSKTICSTDQNSPDETILHPDCCENWTLRGFCRNSPCLKNHGGVYIPTSDSNVKKSAAGANPLVNSENNSESPVIEATGCDNKSNGDSFSVLVDGKEVTDSDCGKVNDDSPVQKASDDGADSILSDTNRNRISSRHDGLPEVESPLNVPNIYQNDLDEPSSDSDDPDIGGYIPDDEKKICRYFSRNKRCWKRSCNFKHVETVPGKWCNDVVECYGESFNDIDLPKNGTNIKIYVTSVISPVTFYAHLPSRYCGVNILDSETLKTLTLSLNHGSNIMSYEPLDLLPSNGEILVAQCSDKCWYRVRVIGLDDKRVDVFLVDYGIEKKIKHKWLRKMQPRFLHLPFQAVLCRLNNLYWPDTSTATKGRSELEKCILRRLVDAKVIMTGPEDLLEVLVSIDGQLINDRMVLSGCRVQD